MTEPMEQACRPVDTAAEVAKALAANPDRAEPGSVNWLVAQVMKNTHGKASPVAAGILIKGHLGVRDWLASSYAKADDELIDRGLLAKQLALDELRLKYEAARRSLEKDISDLHAKRLRMFMEMHHGDHRKIGSE